MSVGEGPQETTVLTPNDKHIQNLNNTSVFERFEDLDLTQGCHGHTFLLIMHQDAFQCNDTPTGSVDRFVYFPVKMKSEVYIAQRCENQSLPKSTLTQLSHHVIIALHTTAFERSSIYLIFFFSRSTHRYSLLDLPQLLYFPF
jgi:hypothetical protein